MLVEFLFSMTIDKISLENVTLNSNAIHIIEKNLDKISFNKKSNIIVIENKNSTNKIFYLKII